jgi:hypothetical protein
MSASRRREVHKLLNELPDAFRITRRISASTLTAISGGESAPRLRPLGEGNRRRTRPEIILNSAIETAKYTKYAKGEPVGQDAVFTHPVKRFVVSECWLWPLAFAYFAWFAVHLNCGFEVHCRFARSRVIVLRMRESSKFQHPSSREAPNTKLQNGRRAGWLEV